MSARHRLPLLLLLSLGLGLRLAAALAQPLWVDEAESAVNALTILEQGLPRDSYLDLPIYENTLVRPWDGHPEYAFADSSYSQRGLAIYHGWLPLYSLAAACALAGIGPDDPTDRSTWLRDRDALRWRTLVPRLPGLVFSALFLVLLFAAARELFDRGTAWTCLTLGACSSSLVWLGCQARYYSATLALTTAALLCVARVLRRGRWSDALLTAASLVLLFHTHVLSFAIAAGVLGLAAPWWLRHPGGVTKALTAGALVTLGVLPWMVFTGWLDHLGEAPAAWPLLDPAGELWRYASGRPLVSLLCTAGLGALVLRHRRLAPRRRARELRAGLLLATWLAVAVVLFVVSMPAASFFLNRLSLPLLVPGTLLVGRALWLASAPAARWPGRSRTLLAQGALLVLLALSGRLLPTLPVTDGFEPAHCAPLPALAALDLPADARIYATPNDHLVLQWYGGVPAQSIAPVRREFLERADHPIVIVERLHTLPAEGDPLGWRGLAQLAASRGERLDEAAARDQSRRLGARVAREDLAARVAAVTPPLEPLPAWLQGAVAAQRALTRRDHAARTADDQLPVILRGFEQESWADWWPVFFYRFVDPDARRGAQLNYAGLLPRATAHLAPDGRWALLVIPPASASDPAPDVTEDET